MNDRPFFRSTVLLLTVLAFGTPDRAAGGLDPFFGTGGKLLETPFNRGTGFPYAAVLRADGKLVTAGNDGRGDFLVTRFNADEVSRRVSGPAGK